MLVVGASQHSTCSARKQPCLRFTIPRIPRQERIKEKVSGRNYTPSSLSRCPSKTPASLDNPGQQTVCMPCYPAPTMDRPCGTNARLLVDDVAVASSNSTWNKTCLAFVNIRRDYLSAKEACPLLIVWLVLVQVSQFVRATHPRTRCQCHTNSVFVQPVQRGACLVTLSPLCPANPLSTRFYNPMPMHMALLNEPSGCTGCIYTRGAEICYAHCGRRSACHRHCVQVAVYVEHIPIITITGRREDAPHNMARIRGIIVDYMPVRRIMI